MYTIRPCGCKGCRTCLVCENDYGISQKVNTFDKEKSYVYCPLCNKAWPGWDLNTWQEHPNHTGDCIDYEGVYVELEFISQEEETQLLQNLDNEPWDLSQSGRRKQNYGPMCNFNKRKLKLGKFNGYPRFTKFIQDRFKDVPILENFQTVEQCSLEYDPEKGASIDSHIDDCWIWGERIVTVNLLTDSVLSMNPNVNFNKYNLACTKDYTKVLDSKGCLVLEKQPYSLNCKVKDDIIVRIPMPRRSLLVLYGSARYDWEHQVFREDIVTRRVCIAYREFTPPYLLGGDKYLQAVPILEKALVFW